ncbi:MAG: serine/threonine-protein kinase [Nannocystaceae bacterium]
MTSLPAYIGPYKVSGVLGKGAMGEVYEGADPTLGRRVALKVLGRKHRESTEFKQRFLREARALGALNHPNIVQIYYIGEHEQRPFLAMEYLDGDDIGSLIKSGGALCVGDAAEVIRQASIGLMDTERAGVVHRDIKPSNILVTKGGLVKVTDFGLAKALEEDLSITATGVFVGTPDYLAPEQAMGEEVNSSADVYALGCSLFHMCSGRPPFREGGSDDHYTAVVRRHLKADRPHLKAEVKGMDEELSDLCRRMMSRDPRVRPDLNELANRLQRISTRLQGCVPPRFCEVERIGAEETGRAGQPTRHTTREGAHGNGRSLSAAMVWAIVAGLLIGAATSAAFFRFS